MWVVKNKGGSPVKAASINKNFLRQAELLGLSGDAARIAAAGAQIAEISGKKLPLMPVEKALPPVQDWSLNGSFNLWLDENTPLYFLELHTPTLTRKAATSDKTYMSQYSCEIIADEVDEGIIQMVSLWAGDDYGPNIYDQRFEVPWTLLLHICDAEKTAGSWRLRLGWLDIDAGTWSSYREIVFDALTLPQYEIPMWPAVLVHLPPNKNASGELIFELVAQTTGKILIDSFQLLPGEFNHPAKAGYPIWAPPALQPVEIDWSKYEAVGAGIYRMGHTISPIKLSAFKVNAAAGLATIFTPRVGGVNMTNLAVSLGEVETSGMAHYPQGYYCSLNSLLDVVLDNVRSDICATLFGIRLPW